MSGKPTKSCNAPVASIGIKSGLSSCILSICKEVFVSKISNSYTFVFRKASLIIDILLQRLVL